jgi:hypothetical protein
VRAAESPEIASAQKAVDTATAAERTERVNALNDSINVAGRIAIRDLASRREVVLDTGAVSKAALFFGAGDTILFSGSTDRNAPLQVHVGGETQPLAALTSDRTDKVIAGLSADRTALLFTPRLFTPRAPAGGRGGRG